MLREIPTMTTSAAKSSIKANLQSRQPAGMTLLEVVVAMSLLILLMGLGAISYASGHDERVLREATSSVEAMASRGHAMSVLHQKPFWVEIEAGRVRLVGADTYAPAGEDSEASEWSLFGEEEKSNVTVYEDFATDVQISIRRWGTPDEAWIYPEDGAVLTWHFQSTGLCEPLAIKFENDDDWVVLHMHPLTARAVDEDSHIQ